MAGLYLHIPFCEHKCIYCDFYSLEDHSNFDAFCNALKNEILLYKEFSRRERFETIFFGGGTPSLLTPPQLEEILSLLYKTFSITSDAEITVETNPGTVDAAKLSAYRSLGVNRLSVGIQSFHDDELRFLTRIHSGEQAQDCVRSAHRAGFSNVSVDLIFALPNQTIERWTSNLRRAVELQPQHISAYSLIVEKGTPLARMVAARQVSPIPVERDALFYELTMQTLAEAGYEQYEVSNFALPGFRSRHNANYWNHTNYLGFGPSAHSFWMSGMHGARRWWNIADLKKYIERIASGSLPTAGGEVLGDRQLFEEELLLGLRSDGIDLGKIRTNYGIDLLRQRETVVRQLCVAGLAVLAGSTLRLTNRGYVVCDEVVKTLLVDVEQMAGAAETMVAVEGQQTEVSAVS